MDGKTMNDSIRFKTMPLGKIDVKHVGEQIQKEWSDEDENRSEFLLRKEQFTSNWRDLSPQDIQGPWENSSNFHVPISLFYGKAIHARLWQIFADQNSFFGVKARKEVFQDQEGTVQNFMRFILNDFCNGKVGVREVFDAALWESVFDGSAYLKVYWQRDEHEYVEVVNATDVNEETVFDQENLTGRVNYKTKMYEKEEVRTEVVETPHIKRCLPEDIILPRGFDDPQTAPWATHRIPMTSDELKSRAREGKFDKNVVSECLANHRAFVDNQSKNLKRERMLEDGVTDPDGYFDQFHSVLERYGRIYVKKEIEGNESEEIEEVAQECVVWVHQATGKVLGWTYLYRISPSGIRPLFKWDFIKFPDRNSGVGVAEVLAPIQQAIDAVYNLRQDNGIMASTPFGFYKSASGLKPDRYRIQPGEFIPVDNPQTDVKVVQMPFLNGFGYQEEDRLIGYAERLLSISDLQIRGQTDKVGMFRTASGASAVQSESGIQLEIHFDRIARTMSKMLQCLFRLCRERIPSDFYYRITGEEGKPIFGKVNRDDLRGEYDFEINIDVLSQGKIEAQQSATLLMQTLLNPAFMQTGVVGPDNLYHLAKNFLLKNRVKRIDQFISPPPQYQGEPITPEERLFRITVGQFNNPPIEETVRLSDNHEKALQTYESFKQSDQFGLWNDPAQMQALHRLEQKHQQYLLAAQAGGNPNMAGMQTPREGMAPLQPVQAGAPVDQGTLGAPMGTANGPVT